MAWSWGELPVGRVVRLQGAGVEALTLAIDPLPDDAPAIVTYVARKAPSTANLVTSILDELEAAAVGLFPSWLPEAEGIGGPGGAGVPAVRSLALRTASATGHFGPFLADLAELSLHRAGASPTRTGVLAGGRTKFAPETRAAGLARVLAASFQRAHASILVAVPAGLSPIAEEILTGACEWLAHRGGLGVWLAGAPLTTVDRLETRFVRLPAELAAIARELPEALPTPASRTIGFPAVAGRPHPGSAAEQALERALSACEWAIGRAWNQAYRPHPLVNPIRLDLLWRDERCVVEIDGPDHLDPVKYALDRQRDVRLQTDGYAVLRFTNDQIMTDPKTVIQQIQRFLLERRRGTPKG
ncbi:endonuclease domain-containing protein [Microtetraspora malaysiensis]|uniref:Endonuclease domain-containing protein n=1 Tax=Microtetraspora malaysiensis TaxID=161358 RepID=A0ABW6T0B8_9ACTN